VAVGVRYGDDGFKVHAPFGLGPLLNGSLIPNTALQVPEVYADKARRWMTVWPQLTRVPWPDQPSNER
jgi:hypothetical protein